MRRQTTLLLLTLVGLGAVAASGQPRELGDVRWQRELAPALAEAEATGKPLFVLFQEIPGCQTCVSFGDEVLSHPLLVEAIEEEFVPVAIYNNRPGADRAILERYGEPAWNNPVVRFLGADGKDVIPRRDGVWSAWAIAERSIEALEQAGRDVPAYLRSAADELTPRHTERATLGMYCYWSGEACLGGIDGVVSSRTGALGGHEVVELRFDPDVIGYAELLREAKARGCADRVFAHGAVQQKLAARTFGSVEASPGRLRPARDKDQRYYLGRSQFASLPLTDRQSLAVNSALGRGRLTEIAPLLSPRQRARLER